MHANLKRDESDLDRAAVVDQIMVERRAKRGFLGTPVPAETINDILNAARFAPSSSNTQPWRCYVLTGGARHRITSKAVEIFQSRSGKASARVSLLPAASPRSVYRSVQSLSRPTGRRSWRSSERQVRQTKGCRTPVQVF